MPFKKVPSVLQQNTQFQPGHHGYKYKSNAANKENILPQKTYSRLPAKGPLLSLQPCCKPQETPTVLRPVHTRDLQEDQPLEEYASATGTDESYGYRILSLKPLMNLFSQAYISHLNQSPRCKPTFIIPQFTETHQGLGTSFGVRCSKCNYVSEVSRMYDKIDVSHSKYSHGGSAEPNVRLAAWHITHGSSYSDTLSILSFLDIPSISENGLAGIVKNLNQPLTDLGNETLCQNRSKIKQLMKLMNAPALTVATDTAYNNPCKGRAFQQNGTQSCTPMQELLTKKKLTLSINSLSQACTCGYKYVSRPCLDTCPANVATGDNVGSLESKAAVDNITTIQNDGIPIESIVADGTHQVASKLSKEIKKLECAVHLSRAARRVVYKVAPYLSKDCCSGPAQTKALANDLVNRCKVELTLARKQFSEDTKFFIHMKKARSCIIRCLSGEHTDCTRMLLGCCYTGLRTTRYRRRSQQKQWIINQKDAELMQQVVDNKLSDSALIKQINIQDTNKVEAFHLRCFKLNPKSKLNKTTYHSRNLHAVTIDTKGIKAATDDFLEKIGLQTTASSSCPSSDALQNIDKKSSYHAQRQQTSRFKHRRCELRQIHSIQKHHFKLRKQQ